MPLGGWAFDDGSDSDGGTGDAMVLETGGRAAVGSLRVVPDSDDEGAEPLLALEALEARAGAAGGGLRVVPDSDDEARTTIKALWNFMVKQLNQKKMRASLWKKCSSG